MWGFVRYVLDFAFSAAFVFAVNYIVLIGFRDVLYFLLPIGPRKEPLGKRLRALNPLRMPAALLLKRTVFWLLFVAFVMFTINIFLSFIIFIIAAWAIFAAAEKRKMAPEWLVLLCSSLILFITWRYVSSQPVIMKIGNQFSVDLWIYNTANSMIDVLLAALMKIGADTHGIERVAGMVPYVQENLYLLLGLAIYVFSGVVIGGMAKIILPGTKYTAPPYWMIPPPRPAAIIALLCLGAAHLSRDPGIAFVVAGLYYIWGVNLVVFLLRGGRWPINVFILVAALMNPYAAIAMIIIGVIDNLLDIRRLASAAGLSPEIQKN